ncbi:hypothetical protein RUND412_010966, partial [Rhizina undulata]
PHFYGEFLHEGNVHICLEFMDCGSVGPKDIFNSSMSESLSSWPTNTRSHRREMMEMVKLRNVPNNTRSGHTIAFAPTTSPLSPPLRRISVPGHLMPPSPPCSPLPLTQPSSSRTRTRPLWLLPWMLLRCMHLQRLVARAFDLPQLRPCRDATWGAPVGNPRR